MTCLINDIANNNKVEQITNLNFQDFKVTLNSQNKNTMKLVNQ